MKAKKTTKARSRAEIIAEFASLPPTVQGKICEARHTLADGKVAVYHNLQYWANGRNHTVHIPKDRLAEFRDAVKSGAKARELLFELSRTDAEAILEEGRPLKKNSSR